MEPTDAIGDDVTLFKADCRGVLAGMAAGSVPAVVTDPPYGIGEARNDNASRSVLAKSRDYGVSDWDDKPASPESVVELRRVSQWQIIFGGNYFDLPPSSCWLVWDKLNGENDFADCELAWTNLRKAVRRIAFRWHGMIRDSREDRVHPTQKPVAVMRWCLGHLPDGCDTILDPFMGSGTTGLAALQAGKKFIGIERDERHYATSLRRLKHATGQGADQLFAVLPAEG